MQQIIEIIENLREKSGNDQLEYLKQYKDNVLLKEVLLYTYDTDKKYKINKAKLDKALQSIITTQDIKESDYTVIGANIWEAYKKRLDELASQKGVKEADVIRLCREFFVHREKKSYDLLRGILLKDLRLNMGVKLFNKVWEDFCTSYQVQLANKYDGREVKNPYYSRKYDGKRTYFLNGIAYSRTNKPCNVAPIKHIIDEIHKLENYQNAFFDGEMLYFDENGKEDFQKGISLTSKEEREDDCKNICYVIFDLLPKENFVNKEPFMFFKHEYQMMLNNLADKNKKSPCYSLIPTILNNIYIARQDNDISKLSELRDKNGWEGVMVRSGEQSYEYKRTNNLLKIKKMQDSEFDIVGFFEGSGRLTGTLGGITIKLPTGEKVDVGSGYSDDDRKYIWENQDKILNSGYQLKVQFFENTKDKDGNNSLRFPVFKAFRKDNVETMRI